MQVHAITRNVRMSAQKMREVVRQIQGLPALQAQAILAVVPRKGARIVAKTLASAIANAEHLTREWAEADLRQKISDLEKKIESTRNRKARVGLKRRLDKYQSFVGSSNRLSAESLRVKGAVAGAASTMRRFTPKARGSAGPILKRNCHVTIVLSDE